MTILQNSSLGGFVILYYKSSGTVLPRDHVKAHEVEQSYPLGVFSILSR